MCQNHREPTWGQKTAWLPLVLVATLAAAILLPPAAPAATGDPDGFSLPFNLTNPNIRCGVAQPDGKLLLGGAFITDNPLLAVNFARFNQDGSLDAPSMTNMIVDGAVNCIAVLEDGKILVGGNFRSVRGVPRTNLARLNPDTTVDTAFAPSPDLEVKCLALQPDGKILLGGWFFSVAGGARTRLARLNADGSLDPSFNSSAGGPVNCLAWQPDGKIVVGGPFRSLAGAQRDYLGRLNADGSLDTNFIANANDSGEVMTLVVQPDEKILVGGYFTNLAGLPRNRVARLNTNGTPDTNFTASASGPVLALALQADGKLFVGGGFTSLNGVAQAFIGRLDSNGTLDTNFNAVVSGVEGNTFISSLALQPDGKLLIAGRFGRDCARLQNGPVSESLTAPTASRVQWLRGGSAPETHQVTFEVSTNGGAYTRLGNATRISGGWELTGLSLPTGGRLRARARTLGGLYNGSSGLVETTAYFGPLAANNLNAIETYVEDTPLNLADVVVVSGNTPSITATFTLLTPAAGSLSTGTAGAATSTYSASNGVWTASGPIADVQALLAGLTFYPATNFNDYFAITTSISDGLTPALTGARGMNGTAVNDPPTLNAISNPVGINEDAGMQTVNFAGISTGGGELQPLTVTATSGNTNLLPHPTVSYFSPATTGSLSYTPVSNANGAAIVTVTVHDGGTSNHLATQSFTVFVDPVNDAPSFTKGPSQVHPSGTTNAQTFVGWATGIEDGDPEVAQALTFNVTNSHPGLFTTPPGVAANGTLTYTLNGSLGVATLGVSLTDDITAGGVARTTLVQTFTITVLPGPEIAVQQPPGTTLADGGTKNFGTIPVGAHADLTFTITNSGGSELTGVGVTVDGADAAMFTLVPSTNYGYSLAPYQTGVPGAYASPFSVTAAEVNGDGQPDLISVVPSYNRFSVLTNNGSGGFAPASSPATGIDPYAMTAADVNGDGKVDLISANRYDNTLTVQTNDGSGGFALAASPGVGPGPIALVAADVNGDGWVDLVSANPGVSGTSNTLSVLTNNGHGGFALSASPTAGLGPFALAAADVNGDGQVDLISANPGLFGDGNTLTVLTNNGSGGFTPAASPTVGEGPFGLLAADVNGDGKLDLITANRGYRYDGNTLTVLTNNGSGGFALSSSPVVGSEGSAPTSVTAADVNGDGRLDLISANFYGSTNYLEGSLSMLTNDGSGRFALSVSPRVGGYPNSVTTSDVNGDGRVDFIVSSDETNRLFVLTSTLTIPPTATVPPAGNTTVQVRFAPTSAGAKTAALHITSNDADENPYDLTLTGTGSLPATPVINPQSVRFAGNGLFQFSFSNANNLAFQVLAATNVTQPLGNWTVLGTGTNLGGGLYQFADPQATNFPTRFYRLRFP